MAAPADAAHAELAALLPSLFVADNEARRAAEARLKVALKQPAAAPALVALARTHAEPAVRQLAAVLCRRRLRSHWAKLDAATKASVKQALLEAVSAEPEGIVRRAVAEATAAVGCVALPKGEWAELPAFLAQAAEAPAEGVREAACVILGGLLEDLGGDFFAAETASLQGLLVKAMRDDSARVRATALRATAAMLFTSPALDGTKGAKGEASPATPLVEPVAAVAQAAVAGGDTETAVRALDLLEDFVTAPGNVLGKGNALLPGLLRLAAETACNGAAETPARKRAVELIEGAARRKPRALSKGKTPLAPALVAAICPLCAVAGDDDDGEEDSTEVPLRKHAMAALDAFAEQIASKHILPAVLAYASQAHASTDHNARAAAMDVLGVAACGCSEEMRRRLNEYLAPIVAGLGDAHRRVRGAAAVALAAYAEHLQPEIVETYEQLLPRIFELLRDTEGHVVERACFVLSTFCEQLSDNDRGEEIVPYVSSIIETMVAILRSDRVHMHEVALSCITSAAATADESFAPHAPPLLEMMAACMRAPASTEEEISRRGRATECAGMVLASIGLEEGTPFIPTFVELALANYESDVPELREHTHRFWCNVSTLGKADMASLLPRIVPHVLKSVEEDDFEKMFIQGDDSDGVGAGGIAGAAAAFDDSDDEGGFNLGGGGSIRIHTAMLEEKEAAVQALSVLAEQCGVAFAPFLEQSMAAVEGLMEYFHEDVRDAACDAASGLCACARLAKPAPGVPDAPSDEKARASTDARRLSEQESAVVLSAEATKVVNTLMHALHQVASTDDDRDVVATACSSIACITRMMGGAAFAKWAERVSVLVGTIAARKHPCFEHDESDYEDEDEDEDGDAVHAGRVLDAAVDVLPAMAYVMRDAFAPYLAAQAEVLWSYTRATRPAEDRTMVVAALAEIGEYVPALLAPYAKALSGVLLSELRCDDPQNHRNAAFCVRVLCALGPVQFPPDAVAQVLEGLGPLLNPQEHGSARDNVISAVCSLAKSHPEQLPAAQAVAGVVPFLPLEDDVEESLPVYDFLCELLESAHAAVAPHAGAILAAMGVAALNDRTPAVAMSRMSRCVAHLSSHYAAQLQAVVGSVSDEARTGLEKLAGRGGQ